LENRPAVAKTEVAPLLPTNDAALEAERARREFAASMRAAQPLLASGKLVEGLRELSKWYDHPALSPADQSQLVELLGQLAGTVIYSRDPWLGPPYVVQPGDTLESVAEQCQVPWQLLAKINGIEDPKQLNPGEQLKIIRGPFEAQLNLQEHWLALFVDGLYAGRFAVQGGQETPKPNGTYPVAKFPANSPANVAQRPYISLGGDLHLRVPEDAGVPGVGAVRINQRDMDDVFDMLSERSQVTVRR
jgi:LysM repeat protein